MPIFHLTLAVRGRSALARDVRERRALVRAVARVGRSALLLFCVVDDHLHAAARTDRPGYLARSLVQVVRNRRPDLQLKAPHVEPVRGRAYLRWLMTYLLSQPEKHGLPGHPALWPGSCFQDLVGTRLLPHFDPTLLAGELPRLRLREAFEVVGLPTAPLAPATDTALRRAGAARIVELAAGVFAADPALQGNRSEVVAARALAAQAGLIAGLPAVELAEFVGMTAKALRRVRDRPLDPRAILTLRRRLALIIATERSPARP